MTRVGWLDAGAGAAGDMLLGALADLGALDGLPAALASLPGLDLQVGFDGVRRHGQRAVAAAVTAGAGGATERGLADVLGLIASADVPAAVAHRAAAVFRRLAAAEARVHGVDVDAVHFHEVGAADAIADVLGCCLGLHALGLDRLVVSPVALGGGEVATRHGTVPLPGPAVLGLVAGTPLVVSGGPERVELATPTGVALLAEWADATGDLPAMTVDGVGIGAGSRELPDRANVVRLVVGEAADRPDGAPRDGDDAWGVIEANVDDLDPRLWPGVLEALLAAGAVDAWLTPILMKKGRPAHTLHALVASDRVDAVSAEVFAQTSTIGLRSHAVTKQALPRSTRTVQVRGCGVRVKVSAGPDGVALTATPEWADVRAAAESTGQPARRILAEAVAAATALLDVRAEASRTS
jgi:uncharacterized protein (TIGR00299 family) protein